MWYLDTAKEKPTCRPTAKLKKAISFFPALRGTGFLNMKGKWVPFPDALPEISKVLMRIKLFMHGKSN